MDAMTMSLTSVTVVLTTGTDGETPINALDGRGGTTISPRTRSLNASTEPLGPTSSITINSSQPREGLIVSSPSLSSDDSRELALVDASTKGNDDDTDSGETGSPGTDGRTLPPTGAASGGADTEAGATGGATAAGTKALLARSAPTDATESGNDGGSS